MQKITINSSSAKQRRLAPAAIGNGDLSLLIDCEGMQRQAESGYGRLIAGIRRAGYRYNSARGELIPFGYFLTEIQTTDELRDFTQSLDPSCGLVESDSVYQDGTCVHSESFCCLDRNIVVLKRRAAHAAPGRPFRLRYRFQPKFAQIEWDASGVIRYAVEGIRPFAGTIRLEADVPFTFRREDGEFIWETDARAFTLFWRFDDDRPVESAARLLADSRSAWAAYWAEGFVEVPSAAIQQTYDLAQYHLRISSTRWGLPTGIYDSHWHGRYHAFDEYFVFLGLATSGHLETAAKIPAFRRSLFAAARKRIEGDSPRTETGVITYPWETNEIGEENAPRGMWYDHVFQAASVALSAYEAYRFSGDRRRLEQDWYPLIAGSTEWMRLFHTQPGPDGTAVIGYCTDLERLGALRFNPFMTACSAIAALRAAAETAELLGKDRPLIPVWRRLAAELKHNLPHDEKRYLPYEGCPSDVHSIGQFAGIYPYNVLPADDSLQQGAYRDYQTERAACGNMYANARSGICSWYQCWEALTEGSLGHGERAAALLEELTDHCGCFGELYEIYACGYRPWFTTAEGEMVHALNHMLLQFEPDGTPRIAPAVPAAWRDFAFRLQGRNGVKIECEIQGGRLARQVIENQPVQP